MLAYERGGRWEDAVGVLSRAKMLGVKPNSVMYVTAISAAGKAGRVEVAEQLFSEAMGAGVVDGVLYETIIGVQGMAGNAARAEALFRAMHHAGYKARDYAYCGLIAAHSMSGDLTAALRVRQRMQRDKATPSVHVFNAWIAACERAGQYDKALELLRSMQQYGLEGNGLTAQLKNSIGRKGAAEVESAQLTAAALSAAVAAAGTLLIRSGMF
jgi:pentatricopeptide repeat protein